MKKFKFLPLILIIHTVSYADYTVIYPLTNASITISQKPPSYTDWVSVGSPYNCASASPMENTINEGISYTKNFTNCDQNQERKKTIGSVVTNEQRTVSGINYQTQSVGTKKYIPTYTDWVNVDNAYNCASATPMENTVNEGVAYTKTFSDCSQNQERTKTLNSVVTIEQRTVSGITYQSQSVGTKKSVPTYTDWTNVGGAYNCNQNPKEDTIDEGVSYTKTFSECSQDQERTKTLDSTVSVEKRTIPAPSYQTQSVGTKVAVATYTEWAKSGTPYNCKNIGPMEDTFNEGTVFTKNYNDCSQDYTRTKTYKGVNTTESQTLQGFNYSVQSVGTRSVTECAPYATNNNYRWIDVAKQQLGTPNYKYELWWNGKALAFLTDKPVTTAADKTFTTGGYVYSRGEYKESTVRNSDYKYFYYQVCRKPV